MIPLWVYLYPGLAAFLLSTVLAGLCGKVSRRLGIVDMPGPRKNHHRTVPLLGGVAIFVSFFVVIFSHLAAAACLANGDFSGDWLPVFVARLLPGAVEEAAGLLSIGGAGLAFFLIGLLDDKKAISVKGRFLLEFLVAVALVISGVRFTLGFLPDALAAAVTIVWIVGIANAFNLLDGLDGLSGGVAVICSCILAAVLIRGGQPLLAMLVITLAGSTAGFLRHNLFPARIYMGSSGSLFLGYILAVSVIRAVFVVGGGSAVFPVFAPLMLFAVPLYDTASVMLIRFREGRHLFKGDRSHIHHRLLNAGFSETGTVLFIWLLTFVTGISSIFLLAADLLSSILIFLQVATALALVMLVKHARLRAAGGAGKGAPDKNRFPAGRQDIPAP